MKKKMIFLVVAFFLIFGFAVTESRASLVYQLNTTYNGTSPTSTPPWLTAEFAQNGTDHVTLTLTASLNVVSEFISQVVFNVNPSFTPSDLIFTQTAPGTPILTVLHTLQDAQDATGGGVTGQGFDVDIQFPTAAASRFGIDFNVAAFDISVSGLLDQDFDDLNTTNQGDSLYFISAHVQGIQLNGGTTSGAITGDPVNPVPIPGAVWLLGSGLLGLVAIRRRMRQ